MVGLIVHEWVSKTGGAERVVEQFIAEFPDADVQVLWNDSPDRFSAKTYETWLARTPLRRHKALALPLMPATWRSLPRHRDYDWMLISSHLFAHHATLRGALRIPRLVYAHTPARYIWEPTLDARGNSFVARAASSLLKPLDRHRAQDVTAIAANSAFTRDRVAAAWRREATVIYPPVDVDRIRAGGDWATGLNATEQRQLDALPATYLLGASRFVPYKRLEMVIEAGEATGIPVVLAGDGPSEHALRRRADSARISVIFVSRPSDGLLYALYQRAIAYVFPAIEDFGIMPIEAMALGTPVIVAADGGARETVDRIGGGAVLEGRSQSDWTRALRGTSQIDRDALADRVSYFSIARFRQEVRQWVAASL